MDLIVSELGIKKFLKCEDFNPGSFTRTVVIIKRMRPSQTRYSPHRDPTKTGFKPVFGWDFWA